MGRKNRRKPHACPVIGCDKRGLMADLIRHASAVHPDIPRLNYRAAIDAGAKLKSKPSPKTRVIKARHLTLALIAVAACFLLLFLQHYGMTR